MPRMVALVRSFAAAAGLLLITSCGSSSSTNVTAPSTVECAVTLTADAPNIGAGGGDGALTVTINRECAWTAKPDVDWIAITSATTGQGTATVGFHVAANSGAATRRGGIGVNDRRVDITQAGMSCSYSLGRTGDSIGAGGGSRTISVAATSSCAWTGTSQAAWIAIVAGGSGSGNGTVTIDIAQNTGKARTGTVVIAGLSYTVTQAGPGSPSPCTVTLSRTSQAIDAVGGSLSLNVTAADDCAWTASSHAPWLTITKGAGSGNGTVQATVGANPDPAARVGTLTVGGETFTVNQGGTTAPPACTFGVAPGSVSVGLSASPSSVNVTTIATCAWTAVSNAAWITLTGATSGSGSATVPFSIAANTSVSARSGTLTIARQTITVNQDAAPPTPTCTFTLSTSTLSIGSGKDKKTINVTASQPTCPWTASSDVLWMVITSGASGTGNGKVTVQIDANPDPTARTGHLTIAGLTVVVTQNKH